MPSFMAWNLPQCDGDGNLYFHVGNEPNDISVLKILHDGSFRTYGVVGEDAKNLFMVWFRVSRDGDIYILAGSRKNEIYIIHFSNDSTSPERTLLSTSLNPLSVHNFLVLDNGGFLLQGYYDTKAAAETRGREYLIQFDSSGMLIRESRRKASNTLVKYIALFPGNAAAAEGEDGLFYLLNAEAVVVLNQNGSIVRQIKLHMPSKEYHPSQVFLAGGRLAVIFANEEVKKPYSILISVLDPSSGEQLRLYRPDDALGNSLVCFSNDGFTFLSGDENSRVKLITAAGD